MMAIHMPDGCYIPQMKEKTEEYEKDELDETVYVPFYINYDDM